MVHHPYFKLVRPKSGSSLAEMPPALFLLIFFAVLPVLNLIMMGCTYCFCTNLNTLELNEAARTPAAQIDTAFAAIQQSWQSSVLGQYANLAAPPEANVSYTTNGSDTYVNVSTTFTAKSAINIPYFKGVPGLGGPWTYTIAGNRILEDPSYAQF